MRCVICGEISGLDLFASEAIRYSNFYATSSWTIPSHASIFTGLYPIKHGATQENFSLASRFATLAEVLDNAGYQTFAASQNPFVSDAINLAQGFSEFVPLWTRSMRPLGLAHDGRTKRHVVSRAFQLLLEDAPHDRPFFAFLNYIDAHLPSAPPEPFLSAFLREGVTPKEALDVGRKSWSRYYVGMPASDRELQILSDLYDAQMAHLSFALENLFALLRRDGRFDNTMIIVTSDHGEQLGEHHHLGHVFSLYNTTVQIPLIIRMPKGMKGGRVDDRMGQLVDLFPTILDVTGVEFDRSRIHGASLLASATQSARTSVFSEYYYPAQTLANYEREDPRAVREHLNSFRRRLRAIEVDGKRLIWSSKGDHELYDTLNDPGETRNRIDDWPDVANEMLSRLDAAVATYGDGEREIDVDQATPVFDSETEEALRALGYIR